MENHTIAERHGCEVVRRGQPNQCAMDTHYRATLRRLEDAFQARFAAAGSPADIAGGVPAFTFLPSRDPSHGDFASAAALGAGKQWRRNPMLVAEAIAADGLDGLPQVADICVAKPGFINLRMKAEFWIDVLRDAVRAGTDFGASDLLKTSGPILIEFASPNPTGPLAIVQGRSGSLGAALVSMLRFAGADAQAETYVNDAGAQLDQLADSLYARYATLCGLDRALPENGYGGAYLVDVARALLERDGDRWLKTDEAQRRTALGEFARDFILAEQRKDMDRFRVHFERWFSEASLHAAGKIDEVIHKLVRLGHAYEHDGAVWLRSTEFGDDKDRVLRRSDGRPTYLAADAAYHSDKLERGYKLLINILGPDHHGYVVRLAALVAALGYPGSLEVLIAQQVTFKRGDEVVAMSKRAGNVITLREVLDEVGVDAARFYFLARAPESHLVFDMDLAVQQSANNPVYYVQYGYARIASIFRRAEESGRLRALARSREAADIGLLSHRTELALIRRIATFDSFVADAARARAPHRLTEYAREVAADFHSFYTECTVLGDDESLTSARLSLCSVAKTVLRSSLELVGVAAPDRMQPKGSPSATDEATSSMPL
ncbi:MAG: arginine--tRNA ligase [Candidatus Eremiobacteraeota bacterium]|nr:arginine--tRNA ligase [Candidatus Eremiobacteraeota bacterium]MBC5827700.1 arginine--tRNA ligase [Candidatus Eremiobacteraeota bacterium]